MDERVQGSNWRIKKYNFISADMDKTRPSRASSYIELPAKSQHAKCGLINIKNLNGNKCFSWCMLYHQGNKGKNDSRISVLLKVVDQYDWTGINFPASMMILQHLKN